jgi:hypothetical protein
MNGYELSRKWFDWCFENPERISPNHTALYFFIIEHCNRLGWKAKFGLPTTMVKEAIGIRSYNTYINTLNDLVDFGFVVMIEKSKNQYSSNIVALSNFDKAHDKALDKALIKHTTKQCESNSSIVKQETINNKPSVEEFVVYGLEQMPDVNTEFLTAKYNSWVSNDWCTSKDGKNRPIKNWKSTLNNTLPYLPKKVIVELTNDQILYNNVMAQINNR